VKGEGAGLFRRQKGVLCGIVSAAHLEVASTLSLRPFYYYIVGEETLGKGIIPI